MKRMMKHIIPVAALALLFGMTSCTKDLDVTPIDPNLDTVNNLDGLFNKCYGNFGLQGNGGANGDCDIDDLDGGTTGLIRQMWNSNELTSDEALCSWGDDGIQQFCYNTYDSSHPMMNGYFARLTTGISYCNHYLDQAGEGDAQKVAEIRFVRALQYYLLMDAFGGVPFATTLGNPTYMTRQEIYNWLVEEVTAIEPLLADAKARTSSDATYGRADKAAAWMLLMRLYLNAEVYTGTAQWAKAAEYAKKVIDSPYKLNTTGSNGWSAYQMLFMGDNGESSAAQECVWPVLCDGKKTTSWGVTLFLMASIWDADMDATANDPGGLNGTSEKWAGNRARINLVRKFFPNDDAPQVQSYDMKDAAGDDRALFFGIGHTLDNPLGYFGDFKDGYAVAKFINYKSTGAVVKGSDSQFPDADFFFFRVAEAYLSYAEAITRQAGASTTTEEATRYINALRQRANSSDLHTTYSMNELLDEWCREFYFEGRRRVDLIRFGKFGGDSDYNWVWKGGAKNGRSFSKDKNVFAIPAKQVKGAIQQNPGY